METLRGAAAGLDSTSRSCPDIDDEQLDPMLARLGLHEVIDAATSSEQARSCKPDAAIYRLALGRPPPPRPGPLRRRQIRHDIEGPAAIGMSTAGGAPRRRPTPADARPDAVINTSGTCSELVGGGAAR